jgi:hypothetical protein
MATLGLQKSRGPSSSEIELILKQNRLFLSSRRFLFNFLESIFMEIDITIDILNMML